MNDVEFHKDLRAREARQGYINWRMADLPSVYQNLMPFTICCKELWQAEKAIRVQHQIDRDTWNSNPWRRVGPQCGLINYERMTGKEEILFACEIMIPRGMDDRPKEGGTFDPATPTGKQVAMEATARWLKENPNALDNLTDGQAEYAASISADMEKANAEYDALLAKREKEKSDANSPETSGESEA